MNSESIKESRRALVDCGRHGAGRQQAFVCEHLLHGVELGFFYDPNEDTTYPDAWCPSCEKMRIDKGGGWTEELTKAVNIQLVCGDCYKEIKARNAPDHPR